uniref:ras-specific guanine nucleotide-releasing factor RalGPS1-like isoform X2 n=1 Tax=Panthera onca TaxID=9690 RepID=UPI002952E45E|nr:ras-specific guanine nucleotide-releasing factor RalGPS1-like isoform X2 [Panthera onca]
MYKRNGLMASVLVTSATPQGSSSSDSLEGQGCDYASKSYDAVVFDVLKSQITLMDIPVFKAIQPEELASCGWSKKEKHSLAPNVVAFTRRFNQLLRLRLPCQSVGSAKAGAISILFTSAPPATWPNVRHMIDPQYIHVEWMNEVLGTFECPMPWSPAPYILLQTDLAQPAPLRQYEDLHPH